MDLLLLPDLLFKLINSALSDVVACHEAIVCTCLYIYIYIIPSLGHENHRQWSMSDICNLPVANFAT